MISDDVVLEAGYDPASRKRYSGFAQPPNISLGCEFEDDGRGPIKPEHVLDIASTNEDINRYRDSLTKTLSAQRVGDVDNPSRVAQTVLASHHAAVADLLYTPRSSKIRTIPA